MYAENKPSLFRIAYKPHHGMSHYVSRIIQAKDSSEAIAKLGGYFSIRSITVQCAATTKAGHACQRFSHETFCNAHKHWNAQ